MSRLPAATRAGWNPAAFASASTVSASTTLRPRVSRYSPVSNISKAFRPSRIAFGSNSLAFPDPAAETACLSKPPAAPKTSAPAPKARISPKRASAG